MPTALAVEFIARVADWAQARRDLRAVLVVGSQVRTDRPADEWSDIDFALITTDPGSYVRDDSWLATFGTVWVSYVEDAGVDIEDAWECRAMYEGALDVDFGLLRLSIVEAMLSAGIPPRIGETLLRGLQAPVDKDGLVSRLLAACSPPSRPGLPKESEFLCQVKDSLFRVAQAAKKLRRGELMMAKVACDGYLKDRLRVMLGWHARALQGSEADLWHDNRFLEQWADPRAVAAFGGIYARYDREDIARALLATLDLYRWLAQETACKLGYTYPAESDAQIAIWTRDCLAALGS